MKTVLIRAEIIFRSEIRVTLCNNFTFSFLQSHTFNSAATKVNRHISHGNNSLETNFYNTALKLYDCMIFICVNFRSNLDHATKD